MNMSKYVNCYDKFDREVKPNDFVDIQKVGVHQAYMKDGQLCFKPYGKEDKVYEFFSNDMVLCDGDGNWITDGLAFNVQR